MRARKPDNKIVSYMLITAVMVVTFICAIAISRGYSPGFAWTTLLATNLCALVYLSRK